MKKAVIQTGAKQYLVSVGDRLAVELLQVGEKAFNWQPLLVIDGDQITVGKPRVEKIMVKLKVVEDKVQEDKVVSIRFKAKKRVNKKRGHRQQKTVIEVVDIA